MPTLVIGISSDVLYPLYEQQMLHDMMPGSEFFVVNSNNGHGERTDMSKIFVIMLKTHTHTTHAFKYFNCASPGALYHTNQ